MGNVGVAVDGAVLRALRDDHMWTMAELASRAREFTKRLGEHAVLDKWIVCRAESGQSKPSRDNVRFLVGALAPSQEELGLLLCGAKPPRVLVELCRDAPARQVAAGDVATVAAILARLEAAIARLDAMVNDPDTLARQPREGETTRTAPRSSARSCRPR